MKPVNLHHLYILNQTDISRRGNAPKTKKYLTLPFFLLVLCIETSVSQCGFPSRRHSPPPLLSNVPPCERPRPDVHISVVFGTVVLRLYLSFVMQARERKKEGGYRPTKLGGKSFENRNLKAWNFWSDSKVSSLENFWIKKKSQTRDWTVVCYNGDYPLRDQSFLWYNLELWNLISGLIQLLLFLVYFTNKLSDFPESLVCFQDHNEDEDGSDLLESGDCECASVSHIR